MLSRINRLSRRKDFENIFNCGQTYQSSCLTVRLKINTYSFSRFGLVVSSAVAKKATVRNRLRRQLSEIVRRNLGDLKSGVDVVLISKPALAKKPFKEIEKEAAVLFKKAELLLNQ